MNYKAKFSDKPLKSSCNKCENDAAPNSLWDQRRVTFLGQHRTWKKSARSNNATTYFNNYILIYHTVWENVGKCLKAQVHGQISLGIPI